MKHINLSKLIKTSIFALGLSTIGMVPTTFAQNTTDPATTTTQTRDTDSDWEWIGLLGLIGLAGLFRRDKNHRDLGDRTRA